jgi:hypothetical protein
MLGAIAAEDKGDAPTDCHALLHTKLSPTVFPMGKALGKRSAISPPQHHAMRRQIAMPRLTACER